MTMTRGKINIRLFLPLGIALISALPFNAAGAEPAQEAAGAAEDSAVKQPAPAAVERQVMQYRASDLRDPFSSYLRKKNASEDGTQTLKEEIVTPPQLNVEGVIWGDILNQAIINNKVVRIGDTIEECTITGIDKGGVTISFKKHTFKIGSPAAISAEETQKGQEGGENEK